MLKSIRAKILLAILTVTMFTACSLTVVFYFRAAEMIEENYSGILYGRMQQTVKNLDESLKEIYYVNMKTAWDEDVRNNAEEYIRTGNENSLENIAGLLREYSREYKDINSLYFVFPDKKMAVTSEEFPANKQGIKGERIEELEEIQERDSFPVLVESLVHEGSSFLSVIQKVEDDNGEALGYVAADIKERAIYYEYLEAVNDEKITRILLVDGNNEIVTSEDYSDLGKTFPEITDHDVPGVEGYIEKNGVISFFSRGSFSDCGLYLEVPKKEVLSGLSQMRLFLIGIFGAVFVAAVLLALWLSRVVCGPLRSMTGTIEKVGEGDLSLRTEVTTADEIGTLGKEFNHMLDYIEDLIAQVIEEEQQKKDAELEALQYQITPHFMYNTLFSIKCMVDMGKNEEASGMLVSFIQLLRSTLSNPNEFVMIREEFRVLRQYVEIQKFRYDDGFQVIFECDEGVEEKKIPKLLIQPLLENAIFHGVEFKRGEGLIIITARAYDGGVAVTVEDNGMGIAPEIIEKINRGERMGEKAHVGIVNVKERIQLNFGGNYGMKIESVQWKGTKIILNLPAVD